MIFSIRPPPWDLTWNSSKIINFSLDLSAEEVTSFFKVGANTWSIMHEFLKLLWIMIIYQKAKACSCRLYRVTMQKVAQILSQNRGKKSKENTNFYSKSY